MPAAQTFRLASITSPLRVLRCSAVTSLTVALVITLTPSFSRVWCTGVLMRFGSAGSTRDPASIKVMCMSCGLMRSKP
ncbi:hypothetical protein D3C80_1504450 [compost metagenome]